MSYHGSWKIDDYLTFCCNTHDPDTGVATDADAVPTYRVYEDETGTAILTGSMAKLDDANTTGFYSERIQLTAANGFEKGKCYTVYITATVDSDTGTMHHTLQIEAEVDANTVSATNVSANVAQISDDATAADNLELITEIANITSLTVDAAGHLEANVVEIEGADPTDTIRDAVVDDATRLDASSLNAIEAKVDTVDTVADAILADTNELQTDWADGGRLDLLLDAATAGAGAGAITFTYTLTSSVDSAPIASATVWVTTDQAGTNVVASGTTNTSGEVVFYLDAGTYYVWREKSGWNFTNPDTETVA